MVSFYLMGEKGLRVLTDTIKRYGIGYIDLVVTAKDPNVTYDFYDDILQICNWHQVKVFNRTDEPISDSLFVFSISWRWILPLKQHQKLIVLHDSLLPKYRGFSPLVNCLINGDAETGVTALFGSESYDRGDIIAQQKMVLNYPIKIKDAIELISNLYVSIVNEILSKVIAGDELPGTPQDELKASYSLWRSEEDYFLNWNRPADEIKRTIDALGYPYLGAASYIDDQLYRILDAEIINDVKIENRDTGKVIFVEDGKPIIVCSSGLLKITEMVDDATNVNVLPLKKFRFRFK